MAKRQLAAKTATSLFAGLLSMSAAVSTPAFAADDKDPGWYFGLNGGYGKLSDTQNDVAGTPGTSGGVIDLLGLGLITGDNAAAICGLPVISIILGQLEECVVTPGENPSAGSSFKGTYKDGEVYGINLGYSYAGGLRPEFGLMYRSNDFESVNFNDSGSTSTATGQLNSISLNGNLWYDFFKASDTVRPYVGVGLGASQLAIKDFSVTSGTTTTTLDDKQTSVSYQFGAGVGFKVGDSSMLSLGYRYLASGDTDFETDGGTTISSDYKHSSVLLGLNIFLKSDALVGDSDGDGVPDNVDKCPDTPLGVIVGPDGCPADADGDGVPDAQDKCPGTPAGVTVGPDGCPIDSDGDGVADSLDKCPGSPAGVAVGPDGCPLDSDNDGVPDNLDKCPGTPAGAVVDANGCEPDGDGDGVPDRLDRCPDTPAGEKVGPNGCPNDSDGDGVPDDQDECPNTPAGAQVLANGCALKGDCRTPRPGEEVDANGCAVEQVFILRGVNFEFDSDRLTPEAKEILKQVAQTLKAYPDVNVEIAGHTDSTGTDAYNLGLSEKRSIAVKNFLTGEGVDAARMSPTGYGESQPIDTNETPEGQAKNRRVELRVIDDEAPAPQQ